MRLLHALAVAALAPACAAPACATLPPAQRKGVVPEEQGNRVSGHLPAITPPLIEQLSRYQNTRGTSCAGWTRAG